VGLIKGSDVTVSVSSDDSTYYELNGLDNLSNALDVDLCDYTDFGDDAHAQLPALFNGSFEIGGWFDAVANGQLLLIDALKDGSAIWCQAEFGSTAVNVKCKVEKFSFDAPHDCVVKFSATMKAIAESDTVAHTTTTESPAGPFAGKNSMLYFTGSATAVTSQSMTLVSGKTYKASSATHRIWDPTASVVVYDGGTPIAASGYTIDHLFGQVTLVSSPGGTVTADFSYLAIGAVAQVRGASVDMTADLADSTSYGDEAHDFEKTTCDCSGTMDLQQHGDETIVSSKSIRDLLEAKEKLVIDLVLGDSGYMWRGFVVLKSSGGKSSPANNLVTRNVAFVGSVNGDAYFGVSQ